MSCDPANRSEEKEKHLSWDMFGVSGLTNWAIDSRGGLTNLWFFLTSPKFCGKDNAPLHVSTCRVCTCGHETRATGKHGVGTRKHVVIT